MVSSAPPRVVVIGGGITGLTAAYRLRAARIDGAPEVTLLESSPHVGGKLRTTEVGGCVVEAGPDSFVVRKPAAADLCKELGLGEDLLVPATSGAYVWARGRLVEFPAGSAFGIPSSVESIARWPGLSPRGRAAAALDLWRGVPRSAREADDETASALVARRLGREAADVLVLPVLAGIHAADPDRMSMAATFPELRTWELGYGSLMRGARAARRSASRAQQAPPPLFATLDGGLQRLAEALVAGIGPGAILTSTAVDRVERGDGGAGYSVVAGDRRLPADAVVVATPAAAAAAALAELSPSAAAAARELRTASTATVTLVYPPGTGARLPMATGFLVPRRSGRPGGRPAPGVITACTWLSRKWPDDSFGDRAVLRCFVGRDGEQDALALEDEALARAVAADVELATPLGTGPSSWSVTRWPDGMPQYDVGHLARVGRIEDALSADAPGVAAAAAPYRGVGIADCVRQGTEAAEAVVEHLAKAAPRTEPRPAQAGGRTEEAVWTN
ncbi:MAG TPA: protoporphyrinogen oxidase [Actinomycetota bacterium]|nr:protoporphyrinogen oxidase [Actinomycetota bacterium]